MRTDQTYSLRETLVWTRRELAVFVALATVPTALYALGGITWIAIPWLPISLIGTAVAFITGFKNNASYGRLWEARKIWGGLVNTSRLWTAQALDYTREDREEAAEGDVEERRKLVYRTLAFLTALRYQLRQPQAWENMDQRHAVEYQRNYRVAEWTGDLAEELSAFLEPGELENALRAPNRATQILALQSSHLQDLVARGMLNDFQRLSLTKTLERFFDDQGRSERIKKFPYPRQFAALNLYFIWLFIGLVPFGLLNEFAALGEGFVWLTIPASTIVAWVFHTMDKIGGASENPFEGGPNDVPITSMVRTIEIDLRQMLGEVDIPPAIEPVNNILT